MTEREQMLKLADEIRAKLDHGERIYLLHGAQLDWVIVALRRLAHGEEAAQEDGK